MDGTLLELEAAQMPVLPGKKKNRKIQLAFFHAKLEMWCWIKNLIHMQPHYWPDATNTAEPKICPLIQKEHS